MIPVAPKDPSTSSYFDKNVTEERGAAEDFENEQNNNKKRNNNKTVNADFYQQINLHLPNDRNPVELMTRLTKEDSLLLENSLRFHSQMRRSHSYNGNGTIRQHPATIKQNTLNECIATSLTGVSGNLYDTFPYLQAMDSKSFDNTQPNSQNDYCVDDDIVFPGGNVVGTVPIGVPIDMDEQEQALLLPDSTESSPSRISLRRNHGKSSSNVSDRSSICYRIHSYLTRNRYLNYVMPALILFALMLIAYLTRDHAKRLLFWIETQNPWLIFAIFMVLFVIVSFPVVVGYFVLMITSGYLFGFFKGLLTVIIGANMGIAIAHVAIRCFRHRIPLHRLIKNETARGILRVIAGPRAFKVVLFTRLTPIPFGLQNAIFGVSSINPRTYHLATFVGLLPAQIINAYLGSTLRSMHEVLNSHGTAVVGYISFAVEAVCGVALMFWIVQKARKELSETLLSCSDEREHFDI